MLFNAVDAHRLEGTRAHVQGDKRHLNAFGAQFIQQRFVEVQTSGRGGYRARPGAVDGLIELAVSVFIRAVNVGRQRHMANPVKDLQHRALVVKFHFKQRAVTRQHGGLNALVVAQQQLGARLRRFRGANMGEDALIIQHPLHQHFDLAAAGLTTEQTRRDHPGVVKHQQIAGIELIEDVGEGAMRQRARRPVQGK